MAEEEKKDPPTISVYDRDNNQYKTFPKNPSTLDYVKEAFQPTNVRANIEAMRRRQAKLSGQE